MILLELHEAPSEEVALMNGRLISETKFQKKKELVNLVCTPDETRKYHSNGGS